MITIATIECGEANKHEFRNPYTLGSIFIGYWLDKEIYVRVLVRSNIARRQPITFLLHTHHYHKKLNNIYYICFHQQNLKNKIFIKQTKIQNLKRK